MSLKNIWFLRFLFPLDWHGCIFFCLGYFFYPAYFCFLLLLPIVSCRSKKIHFTGHSRCLVYDKDTITTGEKKRKACRFCCIESKETTNKERSSREDLRIKEEVKKMRNGIWRDTWTETNEQDLESCSCCMLCVKIMQFSGFENVPIKKAGKSMKPKILQNT